MPSVSFDLLFTRLPVHSFVPTTFRIAAKELAKLADDDLDGHAGNEAIQDRFRDEVGDPAQPDQTGHDIQGSGDQSQGRSQSYRGAPGLRRRELRPRWPTWLL